MGDLVTPLPLATQTKKASTKQQVSHFLRTKPSQELYSYFVQPFFSCVFFLSGKISTRPFGRSSNVASWIWPQIVENTSINRSLCTSVEFATVFFWGKILLEGWVQYADEMWCFFLWDIFLERVVKDWWDINEDGEILVKWTGCEHMVKDGKRYETNLEWFEITCTEFAMIWSNDILWNLTCLYILLVKLCYLQHPTKSPTSLDRFVKIHWILLAGQHAAS